MIERLVDAVFGAAEKQDDQEYEARARILSRENIRLERELAALREELEEAHESLEVLKARFDLPASTTMENLGDILGKEIAHRFWKLERDRG